jgi:superfamily I DNA/RNA helicase
MPAVNDLSKQQKDVVELPAEPFVVSACAGSGKTKTAVHRIAAMRSRLTDVTGSVLLLSFSNVAVETFQREYGALVSQGSRTARPTVEIDTVDGFLTKNLLRPHGHLVMGCDRCPFLVEGHEPFLKSFTIWDGAKPTKTSDLRVTLDGGKFSFLVGKWAGIAVDPTEAKAGLKKLAVVGAYTHESGRYWAYRLLREAPFLLRAIARRYPHILIDEAQDIGSVHQAILELIASAGTKLSMIGDVNQGIFEFTGATGEFLGDYHKRPGVLARPLETNFRSVPSIIAIANTFSGRKDGPDRAEPDCLSGAFYITIDDDQRDQALKRYKSLLGAAEIPASQAAVIFRSTQAFNTWSGPGEPQGQGVVKAFGASAIWRDKARNFNHAYVSACAGIVGLLDNDHGDLLAKIRSQAADEKMRSIRREIWNFVKDPVVGLPSANLKAATQWHPLLVTRVKDLVVRLEKLFCLKPGENLGQKLAKKALSDLPLWQGVNPDPSQSLKFRMSTVHKVKGESIDGVMYVASKSNIEEMLAGTQTENGKIGYVALTRARNLFVLGVPAKAIAELEPLLKASGFLNADAHCPIVPEKQPLAEPKDEDGGA